MAKVYLLNKYSRSCPENNNGQHIVAAFETEEQAKEAIDVYDPKNKTGKRQNEDGLEIIELVLGNVWELEWFCNSYLRESKDK